MTVLLSALGLFGLSWLLHFAWWRLRLPTHHTKALVVVFAGTPVAAAAALALSDNHAVFTSADWASLALFHMGASLCYLITYAGVEETSPSLVIIRALERAGKRGATRDDLQPCITDEQFITPRLDSLTRDGFVLLDHGSYRLTERGRSAARVAQRISSLFNLGSGA
jgi:hypothetical protein